MDRNHGCRFLSFVYFLFFTDFFSCRGSMGEEGGEERTLIFAWLEWHDTPGISFGVKKGDFYFLVRRSTTIALWRRVGHEDKRCCWPSQATAADVKS